MMTEIATPSSPSPPRGDMRLVIYRVAGQCYALPLAMVERVVPVVEITPLSKAPACTAGVINAHGSVLPVIDCRKCFGLPVREIRPDDQLLIAHMARRTVALLVDRVEGVHECDSGEIIPADDILPGMDAQGALKLPDGGIAFLQNLDQCLTPEEEEQLELSMTTP